MATQNGTNGKDQLIGSDDSDLLKGLGDDDILEGRGGADTLLGGDGNDQLLGGDGDDTLSGENGDDSLQGGNGSDFLDGGNGNDTLIGGNGENRFIGGAGNDVISGGQGFDILEEAADVNFVLTNTQLIGNGTDTLTSIDIVQLTGGNSDNTLDARAFTGESLSLDGGAGNDLLRAPTSKETSNSLWGGAGNDTLEGGGGSDFLDGGTGADRMVGGDGNDQYAIDNVNDVVIENGDGYDTIYTTLSFSLEGTAAVEALFLESSGGAINGTGNALNNRLVGTESDNILAGLNGQDQLYGAGGNDTLNGGAGNDILLGGAGNDTLTGGEGRDIFAFSDLPAIGNDHTDFSTTDDGIAFDVSTDNGVAFESDLTPNAFIVAEQFHQGNAAADASDRFIYDASNGKLYFDADGNGSAGQIQIVQLTAGLPLNHTHIFAFDGVEQLTAIPATPPVTTTGTAGNDTFNGTAGGDRYHGLGGNDQIFGQQGDDILNGGVGDDQLDGGARNDTLYGSSGNDLLIGGAGNDRLYGGSGNDRYFINSADDLVSESINGGIDEVISSISYELPFTLENLTLDMGATNGTGNTSDNLIKGNAAVNRLDGQFGADTLRGGGGNDILTGGELGDRFDFFNPTADGIDQITDFNVNEDRIGIFVGDALDGVVSGYRNAGLTANATITAEQFHQGTAAADASDRLIYNSANGALFFDADGSGNGAQQVQIASLSAGLNLTHTNIYAFDGNNNNPVIPSIFVEDVSVVEGAGNAVFTIRLSVPGVDPVTVNYSTADGSASSAGDYVPQNGTLTFNEGETIKTIAVPINNDTVAEADETFQLRLSNPLNAILGNGQAIGTIRNDDQPGDPPNPQPGTPPSLSIGDVNLVEGNSGTTEAVFTVTLNGTNPASVTVNYSTADGTATAGSDYVAQQGTLTFNGNETSKTIRVAVNGDRAIEADETFQVGLSNPTNATLGDREGVGTIRNDDATIPDFYQGTAGSDRLTGGATNDTLVGLDGNDTLIGNAGNDLLKGGSGNDTLKGGKGADTLWGGVGNDLLFGGNDRVRDIFVLERGVGRDVMREFKDGIDKLGLTPGLRYGQLSFKQQGNNLLISANKGKDPLAVLIGVQKNQISRSDFVAVAAG